MSERPRARAPKTADRLGRMLVVVPYLVQHPGRAAGRRGDALRVPSEQLRRDLDLLFMSGLPPYGPGDLIDVDVDEDDRIWISMADHFARPLRLTRSEALAAVPAGDRARSRRPACRRRPPWRARSAKLRGRARPRDARRRRAASRSRSGGGAAPEHLELLREAAETHHRVDIEYFVGVDAARGARRTIEPEAVFSSLGNWYVAAWDVGADAERLFRADRVRTATAHRRDVRAPRSGRRGPGALHARRRRRPRPAAAPRRRRGGSPSTTPPTDAVELDDGSLEVTLPARQTGLGRELLLRVGPDAEISRRPSCGDELARAG